MLNYQRVDHDKSLRGSEPYGFLMLLPEAAGFFRRAPFKIAPCELSIRNIKIVKSGRGFQLE